MQTAEMLVPFVVFGISYANVKFFHKVEKTVKTRICFHYRLLLFLLIFLYFLLYFLFSLTFIPSSNIRKHGKSKELSYSYFSFSLCAIFNKYTSNYKRIVVSNIFDNLFPKIANLGAFCLFFYFSLSQKYCVSILLRNICTDAFRIYLLHQ
jgi:hypothetical protein